MVCRVAKRGPHHLKLVTNHQLVLGVHERLGRGGDVDALGDQRVQHFHRHVLVVEHETGNVTPLRRRRRGALGQSAGGGNLRDERLSDSSEPRVSKTS